MLLASRTSRLYARKGGAGICGRLLSQSNKPVTKNSPSRAKDIIISGLSITVVLGALYLFETKKKEAAKVKSMSKSVGKASVGGPYSLFDQNGTPVTDATFHGHYVLLYFGFTFCPDICPNEINKLIEILNVLDNGLKPHQPRIKPVFITIDPKRDTIGQLKYYSRDFDSRLTWLTGTTEQIETVSRSHRVYTGKVDDCDEDEEYLVDHSSFIYLVGPDGQCLDFYGKGQEVQDVVDSIQCHMTNS